MMNNLFVFLICLFSKSLSAQYWLEEDSTGLKFHPDYFHYRPRAGHTLLFKNDTLVNMVNPQGITEYHWVLPVYPNGIDSLKRYIYTNLKYPAEALKEKKEGIVDVFFKVNKSGQAVSVRIGELYAFGFEEEAKRLIYGLKPFKPGTKDGKTSEFSLYLKINFKLIDGKPMNYEQYLREDALTKAEIAYNIGVKSFNEEMYERAIILFTQTINFNSMDYDAYYNRGLCKGKLADKEGACIDWNKAVSVGGTDRKNMIKHCK